MAKERTAAGNVYTIMQTVLGYDTPAQTENEMIDLLAMESVSAQGFGTVPKIVMLDTRLTAQAKAIYAYFASFAGAGTTAFPRRSNFPRILQFVITGRGLRVCHQDGGDGQISQQAEFRISTVASEKKFHAHRAALHPVPYHNTRFCAILFQ